VGNLPAFANIADIKNFSHFALCQIKRASAELPKMHVWKSRVGMQRRTRFSAAQKLPHESNRLKRV